MTRDEQLRFCEVCKHRQMDMKRGMLCGLTNEKASFETRCEDFSADDKAVEQKMMIEKEIEASDSTIKESPNMRGASWFAWIGGLSLINIVLEYFGVRMIFGLGITSIFSSILGIAGIVLAVFISILYIIIYYLSARKELEWAYRLGFYLYVVDSIVMMILLVHSLGLIVDAFVHIALLIALGSMHPFLLQKNREKAKQEKWTASRICMSIVIGIIIIATLGLFFVALMLS